MKNFLLALPLLLSAAPSFAAVRCGTVHLHHTFMPPYVIRNQFSLNGVDGVFISGATAAINERLFEEGEINDDRNNKGQTLKQICVEGSLAGHKPVDSMLVTSVQSGE